MSNAQLKTLERFCELQHIHSASQVLKAAGELGIFHALAGGQQTAEQLAEHCGLNLPAVPALLDALISLGAVERYGDDYALSQAMRMTGGQGFDLGEGVWEGLAEYVRTGQRMGEQAAGGSDSGADADADADDDAEGRGGEAAARQAAGADDEHHRFRAQLVVARQWLMTPAAMQLAELLEIGSRRRGIHILDFGSGTGVWSLSLAYQDPECRITAVDWEQPLQTMASTARELGLGERFVAVPGNYREVELPPDTFDLAILGNVVHLHDVAENRAILQAVFEALRPGGELGIVDVFPGQQAGERFRAQYALEVSLRTYRGELHPPQTLTELVTRAGFVNPQFSHLKVPPHTMGLLLAAKPALT